MAAGVKDYIKAVSHEVVPAISRGLTRIKVIAHIVAGIVYLALGLHFELPTAWIVGGALAIAALELLLIVPYRLWARLTEQVTHRLILKCMVDEPGCVRRDVPLRLNNGGQIEATWFRLRSLHLVQPTLLAVVLISRQ